MTDSDQRFKYLRDPRLAVHALSPAPVWLWNINADRVLWANPTGAAVFEAFSPAGLVARPFDPRHAAASQIARLSGTLPQGGAPRLERLRGFGARIGGTLICLCSRIVLTDNRAAVLVVATERVGKDLALHDRARRLLDDLEQPSAIFSADGELIVAQPAARKGFGKKQDLVALGAGKLAREASLNGVAEGDIEAGRVSLIKLGGGSTFALLVSLEAVSSVESTPHVAPSSPANTPDRTRVQATSANLPFRFVWETDADGKFTLATPEFADLLGPNTTAVINQNWQDAARILNIDPDAKMQNALAARETFSGIVTSWPADHVDERLVIELSGLPVFDRGRQFKGFRGFGICRNLDRLKEARHRTAPQQPPPGVAEPETKVLPFPSPAAAEKPTLNARERSAFQELARELSERLKRPVLKAQPSPSREVTEQASPPPTPRESTRPSREAQDARPILDRLPVGILVYRLNSLLYANRSFLDWTGYPSLDALSEAGGLDCLLISANKNEPSTRDTRGGVKSLAIAPVDGKQEPAQGTLFNVVWNNENALALAVNIQSGGEAASTDASMRRENDELRAILDTATDGVLVLDRTGHVISANRSAQALFGYDAKDFDGRSIGELLVPESKQIVLERLERLAGSAGTDMLNAGYEVIARVRQGGLVPLNITIGRIEDSEKICVVLRDITAWKRSEEELIGAKRAAEQASSAKSEFLAKISHEIRTPLNAIIGFSEVMMDERFGPIGNERYRQYLKDIHASGGHLISLLNDLLDLSKIEAGKLELTFVSVNLNDLVQQCVAIMQQQANRERVIVRTSLPENLPQIIADARSMRQIVLNLLSNSIKFTGAGGQVIVSTALTDDREVVLRVRDTGAGMSEKELQTALEPFRQTATAARWGSSGTGLGLPITKALAEANQARFRITSHVNEGTLVELAFPTARVLAH